MFDSLLRMFIELSFAVPFCGLLCISCVDEIEIFDFFDRIGVSILFPNFDRSDFNLLNS